MVVSGGVVVIGRALANLVRRFLVAARDGASLHASRRRRRFYPKASPGFPAQNASRVAMQRRNAAKIRCNVGPAKWCASRAP